MIEKYGQVSVSSRLSRRDKQRARVCFHFAPVLN